jgi:hypothetical protein
MDDELAVLADSTPDDRVSGNRDRGSMSVRGPALPRLAAPASEVVPVVGYPRRLRLWRTRSR